MISDAAPPRGDDATSSSSTRHRVVEERMVQRECAGCGEVFRPAARGRPPEYCGAGCRQRAWALRQAEQALAAGRDRRPGVVREVVERVLQPERVVLVPVPSPGLAVAGVGGQVPIRAPGWIELLDELAAQLAEQSSPVAREHDRHRGLLEALTAATVALGEAHPGGLGQFYDRR